MTRLPNPTTRFHKAKKIYQEFSPGSRKFDSRWPANSTAAGHSITRRADWSNSIGVAAQKEGRVSPRRRRLPDFIVKLAQQTNAAVPAKFAAHVPAAFAA